MLINKSWSIQSDGDPQSVRVFVSADCLLCDEWKTNWPKQIPVIWIPVYSHNSETSLPAQLWNQRWCEEYSEQLCVQILKDQFQMMTTLGARQAPLIVDQQGRVLHGWPHAVWLVRWWDETQIYQGLPIEPVNEPDI